MTYLEVKRLALLQEGIGSILSQCILQNGGPGRVFRDTGILAKNLKGYGIFFVNLQTDTGYSDQF